ncbi:MAG: glutamate dehydrogenase [Gelidibacter sp.]|nr:glutamate dehydrogenase [Gelidibacter sp.]
MIYILHVFYGIAMAYFGLISPGMLNMTVLKIRLHVGKTESIKFAFGAAVIVFIQSGIALFFAEFFIENPKVIEILKTAGIFVFFILAIFFFFLSRKKIESKSKISKGNYFFKGMAMSSVNMLAIPFYLGISIYLGSINKIIIEQPYILLFISGAAIGSFLLFYTYIFFAKIISKRISFIATNINIILSLLFLSLGIFTLIKLIS